MNQGQRFPVLYIWSQYSIVKGLTNYSVSIFFNKENCSKKSETLFIKTKLDNEIIFQIINYFQFQDSAINILILSFPL